MFCNWFRNHEVDRVFVKETNKLKLDAVKQHESSKPHQYYQSRYNHTSQTQLNLSISVVDLNLGQNCLDMGGTCKFQGGLVKIPLEQVLLAGKLKSLLWRLQEGQPRASLYLNLVLNKEISKIDIVRIRELRTDINRKSSTLPKGRQFCAKFWRIS